MILHMGTRTTEPVRVSYKTLEPDESEASAVSELLAEIQSQLGYQTLRYDHSMLVYYDPPETPNRRRELLIPLSGDVEGIDTKVFPGIRTAFLVFDGAEISVDVYYQRLMDYMEQAKLEPTGDIYSIEIMYVPEDLDYADYTMEIMVPVKG